MTANELLVYLGQAWWPLFVYPGGITAFALVWLLAQCFRRKAVVQAVPLAGAARVSAVAAPWLALALLPLPGAIELDLAPDAVVVLALVEWPLALAVAADASASHADVWNQAGRRLAAALNGYPALLLALGALAQSSGSLRVSALAGLPGDATSFQLAALHWFGAVTLVLALPPLLGLGPFAADLPRDQALRIGLWLRALGLIVLAVLPWLALPVVAVWLRVLPPLLIGLLLWLFDRFADGAARRWALGYCWLAALQLIVLLVVATIVLYQRLT